MMSVGLLALGLAQAPPAAARQLLGACTLRVPELSFGEYDMFDASPTRSTTRISVTCGGRLSRIRPRIELSAGSSQNFASRTQLSGSNTLTYNIYADHGLTQVVGDGSGGSSAVSLEPSDIETEQKVDLYGAIDPRQLVPAGSYFDTVYVTIIF
jgi:spore coat protein U-like protein